MFQFLDDAVDLLDGVGDGRLLVVLLMRLRTVPALNLFCALAAFSAPGVLGVFGRVFAFTRLVLLGLLRVFGMFGVFFSRLSK